MELNHRGTEARKHRGTLCLCGEYVTHYCHDAELSCC